jgi:hypothetical protein
MQFLNNDSFSGTHSTILQGAVGTALLIGDGANVDFTGATSRAYVFAIHVVVATKFQVLKHFETTNHIMGSLSTVTSENDWDGAGGFNAAANNTDYTAGASGVEFPVDFMIYGKWEKVELHAGTVLAYITHR